MWSETDVVPSILWVVLFVCNPASALKEDRQHLTAIEESGYEEYETIHENVQVTCDNQYEVKSFDQHATTEATCKTECDSNDDCAFFYFNTGGWCKHFSDCTLKRMHEEAGSTYKKTAYKGYETIHKNVKTTCANQYEVRSFAKWAVNEATCKTECDSNDDCILFYFNTGGWCKHYSDCTEKRSPGKAGSTYKKVTGEDGDNNDEGTSSFVERTSFSCALTEGGTDYISALFKDDVDKTTCETECRTHDWCKGIMFTSEYDQCRLIYELKPEAISGWNFNGDGNWVEPNQWKNGQSEAYKCYEKTSAEPNPCDTDNGGCEQTCTNDDGAVTCSCNSGTLNSDGQTCDTACTQDSQCPSDRPMCKNGYCSIEAPCCTNWNEECYTVSDVNNNNYACQKSDGYLCAAPCASGAAAASDECKTCCTTTTHEKAWNCPSEYYYGEPNKDCPSDKIVKTAEECKSAATKLGANYNSYVSTKWPKSPAGCWGEGTFAYSNKIIDPSATSPAQGFRGLCRTEACTVDGKSGDATQQGTCDIGMVCYADGGCDPPAVHGSWSDWGAWSTCTKTCGGGKSSRERTCSNPEPNIRGKACGGSATERGDCNTLPCHECLDGDDKPCDGCLEDGICNTKEFNECRKLEDKGATWCGGGQCSPELWQGYDIRAKQRGNEATCGPCAALVEIKNYGRSCTSFCEAQDMSCVGAWDDKKGEQCSHFAPQYSCGYYWRRTSDVICHCNPVAKQGDSPFVKLGKGEKCPPGTEITTADRCKQVDDWALSMGFRPKRSPQFGRWNGVPFQCSKHSNGDKAIHFNSYADTDNHRFTDGEFVMICEKDP